MAMGGLTMGRTVLDVHCTNPLVVDTDGDQFSDGTEIGLGTNSPTAQPSISEGGGGGVTNPAPSAQTGVIRQLKRLHWDG
jgi:hypothetical protein